MYDYPVHLRLDPNGAFLASFPDVPEAIAAGENEEDALVQALDALQDALEIYFRQKRPIPMPSRPKRNQRIVTLPALAAAKVQLANELLAQGLRKCDFARRLHVHMPQVDRLLNLRHASKLEQIEAAFHELGKRLEIRAV